MQIIVNLQVFLFIIVFIFTKQIKIYGCMMLFVFIHELSHMIIGIILKTKPKYFKIMPLGVSVVFEDYGYKKLISIKKIIIALVGPVTNIIIAIISILLKLNITIVYLNILIAIFNLIPIYPLDGGRALKEILKIKLDNKIANELTNKISNVVIIIITAISSIAILYLRNIAVLFIVIYLWIITLKENKRYKIKKVLYDSFTKKY